MEKVKLEFRPMLSATREDVEFNHPVIPIDEDHPNGYYLNHARLFATLIYPEPFQIAERRKATTVLYAWCLSRVSGGNSMAVEASLVNILTEPPTLDFGILTREVSLSSQQGHIAGLILFFVNELATVNSSEASLNKAVHFVADEICQEQKLKRGKRNRKVLPNSKDQIFRYWYKFKNVSHLYLASYLLGSADTDFSKEIEAGTSSILLLKDRTYYRRFFRMAEHYREFGEGFTFNNRDPRKQEKLFKEGEAWRPSPNFNLSGIRLDMDKNIYPGLSRLLTSWENRKK